MCMFEIMSSCIDFSQTVHLGVWPHVCSITRKETSRIFLFHPLSPSLQNNVGLTALSTTLGMGKVNLLWFLLSSDQSKYGR